VFYAFLQVLDGDPRRAAPSPHWTVPYCTVLHHTALDCALLYCTVFFPHSLCRFWVEALGVRTMSKKIPDLANADPRKFLGARYGGTAFTLMQSSGSGRTPLD